MEYANFFTLDGLSALSTIALVAITAIYATVTWRIAKSNNRMVEAMEAQNEAINRPIVIARILVRHSTILSVGFKNIGQTVARDVRIEIDRDFYQFAERRQESNIRSFNIFNYPIPVLAPDGEIAFDLAQGFNLGIEKEGEVVTPMGLEFKISYNSSTGRSYSDLFPLDFRPYMHSHHPRTEAEHLESIEKHLKKIAQHG